MKEVLSKLRLRTNILRGLLAITPLVITLIVIRFVYVMIDRRVMNMMDQFIGFRIPGLGLVVVLLILYVLGVLSSQVIGRRLFNFLELISNRIPIIKTTYQVGRQVANTLSLPDKQVFKKAVLVECFKPGVRLIGFVTGTIEDQRTNQKFLKIFIPTVPNPTSGYLVVMREADVEDPQWSIDEAMRAVISGGIIGPDAIGIPPPNPVKST